MREGKLLRFLTWTLCGISASALLTHSEGAIATDKLGEFRSCRTVVSLLMTPRGLTSEYQGFGEYTAP
jgi:hypothetical protein